MSLFLQEKKARKHLAATLSCHHRGISLGHEAETRRQDNWFPQSPAFPRTTLYCCMTDSNVSTLNKPASMVILKAVGRTHGSNALPSLQL